MEFEALMRKLTNEDDWKLEMGSTYDSDSGDVVFVAKVTLASDDESYGAIGRTPTDALERAVEGVLRVDDVDEETTQAAQVLKATLDELGFDRAVALLERLRTL